MFVLGWSLSSGWKSILFIVISKYDHSFLQAYFLIRAFSKSVVGGEWCNQAAEIETRLFLNQDALKSCDCSSAAGACLAHGFLVKQQQSKWPKQLLCNEAPHPPDCPCLMGFDEFTFWLCANWTSVFYVSGSLWFFFPEAQRSRKRVLHSEIIESFI